MSNFTVVCGTRACNAECPFCISRMTEACPDQPKFYIPLFKKAIRYAVSQGVSSTLITGRGEPTLYMDQLGVIVSLLDDHMPCIELQTNGVLYIPKRTEMVELLRRGLNTVSFSACSLNDKENVEIMQIKNKKFSIRDTIRAAVEDGFTVRVSFQRHNILFGVDRSSLTKGEVEDLLAKRDLDLIRDAQSLGALQVTIRCIGVPEATTNQGAYNWAKAHGNCINPIDTLEKVGKKVATYHWGGKIYDVEGMSVCVAECISENPNSFDPRSWIFDGEHLRYSWQYKGAIIF